MLNQPAPFPHPGSSGFVRSFAWAEPICACRVVQHTTDGSVLVALARLPGEPGGASHTITVPRADLFEHLADAMPATRQVKRARSSAR